jgi:hypothetical protein
MTAPATDWKESIAADEAKRFERYAEELRALQRRHAHRGRTHRALHAKGNLGLQGELTVLPDLPEHARVALFAKPTTYRAYVRYSNGSGRLQSDTKGDVRGLAVKLLGVDGKKLIPGLEDARTQDFLLIHTPASPMRNAREFVALVRGIANLPLGLFSFMRELGVGRALGLLREVGRGIKQPMRSLATTRYYSVLPIQFGPYAVHYALTPRAADAPGAQPGHSPNYLADELASRLQRGPVSYDFQVQFYVDPQRTPIEDASVEWKEAVAPFVTLARLTLPQQDPASPRGRRVTEIVEKLSFDPWHARTELKPLGSMMRARNYAYRLSTQERQAAAEPDGGESFDG